MREAQYIHIVDNEYSSYISNLRNLFLTSSISTALYSLTHILRGTYKSYIKVLSILMIFFAIIYGLLMLLNIEQFLRYIVPRIEGRDVYLEMRIDAISDLRYMNIMYLLIIVIVGILHIFHFI